MLNAFLCFDLHLLHFVHNVLKFIVFNDYWIFGTLKLYLIKNLSILVLSTILNIVFQWILDTGSDINFAFQFFNDLLFQ